MIDVILNFFFETISWVFNVFLMKIKIFDTPILYLFFGIMILSIIVSGLVNSVKVDNGKSSSKKNSKSK